MVSFFQASSLIAFAVCTIADEDPSKAPPSPPSRAQLGLVGRPNPEVVDYSIRHRTPGEFATFDFEIGPIVSHLFQVNNRGPSAIISATLDIYWPSYAENGKHLLYLIDMPYIRNPAKAKCQVKPGHNVNPAGFATSKEHAPIPTTTLNEEDYEEFRPLSGSFNHNRRPRQSSPAADRREQKTQLMEALKLAKEAGTAVEYRGELDRAALDCDSLNCTQITCDIGHLEANDFVQVEIFSRLWVNTLIDDGVYETDISSLAFAQIMSPPPVPSFVPPSQIIAVTTKVDPVDPEQYQQGLRPWWLKLDAVLIALLILALIVLCCWKLGFSTRNRPPLENVQRAGPTNGERYAGSSVRYDPPSTYSSEMHGAKV